MNNATAIKLITRLLSVLLLAACTPAGLMQVPHADLEAVPDQWQAQPVEQNHNLENLLALTSDEQMHNLVRRALEGNPGLGITALRLKEAGLLVVQSRAGQLPQVDATLNGSRSGGAGQKPDNNFKAGLNLSWEADLWGRLQNATDAVRLEQQALAGDLDAARIALAGQVMKVWLELVSEQRLLILEEARIKNLETAEAMIRERYRNGIGNLEDLNAARSARATSAADLGRRRDNYQRTQRQLKTLLGDLPGDLSGFTDRSDKYEAGQLSKADLHIPPQLPQVHMPAPGLPADTVGRRPDLRAAYRRIEAADLNTRVAYKNLLPGFRLSFDLSDSGAVVSDLLKGSPTWRLLGSLTAPLYNGGRLKAEAQRQELSAEIAFLSYRQVLLNAFLDVENSLAREKALRQQEDNLKLAEQHAEASYLKYQHLYRQGMTDIITLLPTERTAFDTRMRKIAIEKERLSNRVDLALALGIGI